MKKFHQSQAHQENLDMIAFRATLSSMRKNGKTRPHTVPKGFSERLRLLRVQKKLSQEDLGNMIGIHSNHLGRYERGLSMPAMDTLQKLANVLNVSADFLLNGNKEESVTARFDDRNILQLFQEVEKLPAHYKASVELFLTAFINQNKQANMTDEFRSVTTKAK